MSLAGWGQLVALIIALAVTAPLLGRYMAHVYEGGPSRLDRVFGPVERLIYRACRIDPEREQRWNVYTLSVLAFSVAGVFLLFLMQRIQHSLPFNPTDMTNVAPALSLNTAVSFVTNTNWQSYGGENTLSHLTQMVGLTVQNFVSAAAGMAVMVALIRGLSRAGKRTIGNFWVDLVRTTLRILLPLAFVGAIVLLACGVIQNTHGFTTVNTVAGATQKIPGGPVASQISIKQLGTNGGGFFNVNSAHPLENPSKLSDFFELYAILIIPFALAFTFGRMVKDKRQGYAVVAIMGVLWLGATLAAPIIESGGNPKLDTGGVTQAVTKTSPGGNMEGKEVTLRAGRLGHLGRVDDGDVERLGELDARQLHADRRPRAARQHEAGRDQPRRCGRRTQRSAHPRDPVGVHRRSHGRAHTRVPREEDPGGGGEAGRDLHPHHAGDRDDRRRHLDVRRLGEERVDLNPGPHGFSELLYAFTSAANNNGSAFAGITANTGYMNSALAIVMLFGRFFLIIPTLALAGSVVRKRRVPATVGTFPTHTPLFVVLVIGVAVIVAALAFLPALALGPIVEQLKI